MVEKLQTTNRYQTITLFFVIIVLLEGFVLLQGLWAISQPPSATEKMLAVFGEKRGFFC